MVSEFLFLFFMYVEGEKEHTNTLRTQLSVAIVSMPKKIKILEIVVFSFLVIILE